MKEIENSEELEVGQYYHCFCKKYGDHEIHQVFKKHGEKCIGVNRIWAYEGNPQAFNSWMIMGPVDVPQLTTIYLCPKHHGNGFTSDCSVCKNRRAMKKELADAE